MNIFFYIINNSSIWFLVQFGKTYTREFLKNVQIALVLRARAIFVFQKLTGAYFCQIALETILFPYKDDQFAWDRLNISFFSSVLSSGLVQKKITELRLELRMHGHRQTP